MADYSKDDAETRRARAEAKEMADQRKADKAYEASRTTPYAKGGYTRSADGIAQRGKTKGTLVAMCGGGKVKK